MVLSQDIHFSSHSNTDRLSGISPTHRTPNKHAGRGYTLFIRIMRILLPLAAIAILAVVMTWSSLDKKVETIREEDILPNIEEARNELIKPHFESTDKNNRPFTVTADGARQDQNNPALVYLDKPMADIMTSDENWLAVRALKGTYEQQTEKLSLNQNVRMFHDNGYTLETEEMRVDMKAQNAFSDVPVRVQGPAGHIVANGLEAYAEKGVLIFKGPAKLILEKNKNDQTFGNMLP